MSGRRAPLAMLAVAAAATTLVAAPAPAVAASKCSAKHSRTLFKSSLARVYSKGSGDNYTVRLCVRKTNRTTLIGTNDCSNADAGAAGFVDKQNFAAAGKLIAWPEQQCNDNVQWDIVRVYDLRSQRQVAKLRDTATKGVVPPEADQDFSPNTAVTSKLQLDAAGDVAWVGTVGWTYPNPDGGPAPTGSVNQVRLHRASTGASAMVTLDQGAQIPPAPITLLGGMVSWVNDGQPKSAPV